MKMGDFDDKIFVILICIFNELCFVQSLSTENLRHKPATNKLTLAEWPSYNIQNPNGPGTYAYGYEIDDPASKNVQFRDEEKLANGTVQGSYGIVRTNGMVTLTRYISDAGGYRANTQTFNQGNVQATIITTESPKIPSMPSDIGYLDLINPETISKDVAQQQEQEKQQILNENIIPADVAQQILAQQEKFDLNASKISPSNLISVITPTLLDRIDNENIDNNDGDDDADGDDENNEDPHPITNEFINNSNLQTLQTILSGQNPFTITTTKDNQNHTVGIQFINNYIPHNFQLLPFFIPKRSKPTKPPVEMTFNDPIDDENNDDDNNNNNKPFVNDKFHDPLDDFRNYIGGQKMKKNQIDKRKILNNRMKLISSTRRQSDNKLMKLNKKQNSFKNNRYRIILV